MTMPKEVEGQMPEQDPEDGRMPEYVVDEAKLVVHSRSLSVMLLSRRCIQCEEKLDAKGGSAPSIQQQMRQISSHCAKQDDFISPEMPMQEIVFRHMLRGGNKPVSLEKLFYVVTEEFFTPLSPRNISMLALSKVLDSDVYYGFTRSA